LELLSTPAEIEYPDSDGKPMAETDTHRDLMSNHILMFQARYEHDPNAYVSGNNFIYYKEGEPKKFISPDVYYVPGVPKRKRNSYKVWEEGGRVPVIAFEFTSRSTKNEDQVTKFKIYEQELKTQELVYFDPTGDYLKPPLQGHRLVNGRYVRIEMVNGRLYSEELGLEIMADGDNLRLYDPVTEEWLLTPREHRLRADQEARRAHEQAQRANEEAQRANEEAQRANEEARARAAAEAMAEMEARHAREEAEARKASEVENARLRAEIEALRQGRG
ncbi:MAG: Uma2 family endonuclease, partial [Armatimonadota bacterium]|nr:Uma2 family endonuclease [Armatimonadota bacterium]